MAKGDLTGFSHGIQSNMSKNMSSGGRKVIVTSKIGVSSAIVLHEIKY